MLSESSFQTSEAQLMEEFCNTSIPFYKSLFKEFYEKTAVNGKVALNETFLMKHISFKVPCGL